MKILIVEDDEDGRDNLADILVLDDHLVTGVENGEQAIGTCQDQEFDCLLLDWKLPDQSADELIPELQDLQPDKPIIIVTGYGDVEMVVSAMRNGVYDYLEKPINPSVLRATLARVAERQQNLEQLHEVHERLLATERLAAIGQMVAGLAHESRNAFQRSQACLEMLELNLEEDAENLPIISKIQKALEELQRLYEEVREYAAPIVLAKDQVNIVSLLNEAWRHHHFREDEQVKLDLQVADSTNSKHYILDLHRIHQVLRNLLENAIFASLSSDPKEATKQPTVTVKIYEDGSYLFLEVMDQGPGIESKKRETIFEPFFTTKTKGTGLGLAISRRIVEKHEGTLTLLPSEKGAIFQIRLPIIMAS